VLILLTLVLLALLVLLTLLILPALLVLLVLLTFVSSFTFADLVCLSLREENVDESLAIANHTVVLALC